jgi:hypothetical protein
MNTTTTPTNGTRPHAPTGIIAINDEELDKRSCGRITMWSNNGMVTVEALDKALNDVGLTKATRPDAPSALVCLHRAVDAVAKVLGKLETHHKGRGEWAIVSKAVEKVDPATGKKELAYPISCTAKIEIDGENETLTVDGQGADQIREAYAAARGVLAPPDIGNWLCDRVTGLGGVSLRDRGGVYFVPQPVAHVWDKVVRALAACSNHRVHTIPAMRSADAVQAIIAAVTEDTRAACTKIADEIADPNMGTRALKNREKQTATLLARLDQYEALLGTKLDELRAAIDETRSAVAVAALAASNEDTDTASAS